MSGTLVLVVGPSGAGKDTVLRGAADHFLHERRVVFVRRSITRPSEPTEDHIAVTPEGFRELAAQGTFSLTWHAHGLSYGISKGYDDHLASGCVVVINVSRGIVESARRQYSNVRVIEITAPPHVIAARLQARGRETIDQVERRVARSLNFASMVADAVIVNDGHPAVAINSFTAMLKGLLPRGN